MKSAGWLPTRGDGFVAEEDLIVLAADTARDEAYEGASNCKTLDELVDLLNGDGLEISVDVNNEGLSDRAVIEGAESHAKESIMPDAKGTRTIDLPDRKGLHEVLSSMANSWVEGQAAGYCAQIASRFDDLVQCIPHYVDASEIACDVRNNFGGLVHTHETDMDDFDATVYHYTVEDTKIEVIGIHELKIYLSYTVPAES